MAFIRMAITMDLDVGSEVASFEPSGSICCWLCAFADLDLRDGSSHLRHSWVVCLGCSVRDHPHFDSGVEVDADKVEEDVVHEVWQAFRGGEGLGQGLLGLFIPVVLAGSGWGSSHPCWPRSIRLWRSGFAQPLFDRRRSSRL